MKLSRGTTQDPRPGPPLSLHTVNNGKEKSFFTGRNLEEGSHLLKGGVGKLWNEKMGERARVGRERERERER